MSIEINNLTDYKIDKEKFKKIVKDLLGNRKISIALVDKKEIRKINREYRGKDQSTDVLSFSDDDPLYSSEIVICPYNAINIYQVLIHGILHILGYDHERSDKEAQIMRQKEKDYLNKYE